MLPAKERLYCLRPCQKLHFLTNKPSSNAAPSFCSAWQGSCQWCRKKITQERNGKVLNPWWCPEICWAQGNSNTALGTCCELVSKLWGAKPETKRDWDLKICQILLYCNTVVISIALKDWCAKVGKSQNASPCCSLTYSSKIQKSCVT